MDRVEKAVDSLLIKTKGEIFSRIEKVSFDVTIEDTKSKCHCYCLKCDANNNIRMEDLIDFLDERIVDYAIPKKLIDIAKKHQKDTGSVGKIIALRKQAIKLFTNLEKTGEGGELLLYILTLEILKIPQLISKMSLKTSGQVHYQGSDGIHVSFDKSSQCLNLFWGESKMYKDINKALSECFNSLNGFLLDPYSYGSTQERDLTLITQNINNNVNNEEFENLIVSYFDKDCDLSNKLVYKGICFIGYDMLAYNDLKQTTMPELINNIKLELIKHNQSISKKIKKFPNLDTKEIHIFLMPFPSVEAFREYYLKTINNDC